MFDFENGWRRLTSQPDWGWKCLIGGVLMAVPVVNFFSLGYLYRLLDETRQGAPLTLPDWNEWHRLFIDGLFFFIILLLFAGVPLLATYFLSRLPFVNLFGPLSYLPMIPAIVAAAPLSAAALHRFQTRGRFADALEIKRLLEMLQAEAREFAVPTFAFLGFLLAGAPILPFAFFVGAIPVFHFYFSRFHRLKSVGRTGQVGSYSLL